MRNIDQQRAAHAWNCVQGCNEKYVNLAKGAPALIMTSGLMQTLAFHAEKGKKGEKEVHHAELVKHICVWLHQRFRQRITGGDFQTIMLALMGTGEKPVEESRFYQQATDETMELLRWLRQFAPAVKGDAQ